MYQTKLQGVFSLFDQEQIDNLDFVRIGTNKFHTLINNRSYEIEVLNIDTAVRKIELLINGNYCAVDVKDETALLIEKLGLDRVQDNAASALISPMPGRVLDILIAPNQAVKTGTPLLILEAMKMENVLKAEGDFVIDDILVKIGDTVQKNALLVQYKNE